MITQPIKCICHGVFFTTLINRKKKREFISLLLFFNAVKYIVKKIFENYLFPLSQPLGHFTGGAIIRLL